MNKIPVGQAIRFAYAFTFGEIGTVIGLIWIPALIGVVANFFFLHSQASQMTPGQGLGALLLYTVFAGAIFAMIAVAITQQALELRKGPALAHIAFGSAELRVFGGLFTLYMLAFLFATGLVFVAMAVGFLRGLLPGGQPVADVIGGIALVAGLGAILYAMIRLSFLFVPAAVAESGYGITRSWELTNGNFWRIVAVSLGTILPLAILLAVVQSALVGPEYFRIILAMAQDSAHMARYSVELDDLITAKIPLLLGFGFVMTPITNALLFAPAAFAYRVLSGKTVAASGVA